MNIIFLGPPGCGKGTHAKQLSDRHGFLHLSTGDFLRDLSKSDNELAPRIKEFLDNGILVPDKLMLEIIKGFLKENLNNDIIFDGFPRTLEQATGLEDILDNLNLAIDSVIYFNIQSEEIVKRLVSRRGCPSCGRIYNIISNLPKNDELCDDCNVKLVIRADDNRETIMKRINVFHTKTEPLISYYKDRNKLRDINASGDIEKIFDRIRNILQLGG